MVRLYKLIYRLILLFYHIRSSLTDVANVDMGLVKPMTGDRLSICNALVMVNHTRHETSLIPRPSTPPVFDHFAVCKTERRRPGKP